MKKFETQGYEFHKDTVTVGIPAEIYGQIENLSRQHYNDARSVCGILKCYAVVQLHTYLSSSPQEFIPIHSSLFRSNSSGSRYTEYQEFLKAYGFIDIRPEVIDTYTDGNGNEHIYTVSPKSFRLRLNKYLSGAEKSSLCSFKLWPLSLGFPDMEMMASLKQKQRTIQSYSYRPDKIRSTFSTSDDECYMTGLMVKLVKGIVTGKISSMITIRKHIRGLISRSRESKSFKFNSSSDIMLLLYNILNNIQEEKEREKETEQKGRIELIETIGKQYIGETIPGSGEDSAFSYYADLTVDLEGLDRCINTRDLHDIAGLNRIPKKGKGGKIYSVFSRIRRPVRRFIRYRGEHLVEASDVHCAHYAMLPVVFRYCGINVPEEEMERFVRLTQTGDLYGEAVKGTDFTRDEIKPVFQSFYSIKDEQQYLFAGRKKGEYRQRELICRFFRSNFPAIYERMLNFHKTHSYTLKSVANIAESDIMNPICERLIGYGFHPFRLHDAIYMTEAEFDASKSLIDINKEVYKKINENFSKLF